MATLINALTSGGGLEITPDTSGTISFQSAGVTKAGVNSTGLTGDGSQITALTSGNLTGALPAIDGSALTGISGGKVLQVINVMSAGGTSTTGTIYVDMGLSASITPVSASNKVLILASIVGIAKIGSGGAQRVGIQLQRNGSSIVQIEAGTVYTGTTVTQAGAGTSTCKLDSPATTSSVTYKTQFKGFDTGTAYVGYDGGVSSITLMEIEA